tara:strand:- start:483 stop:689 length:207 start_codon:yes stop_codon:yes gene_type:complete
MQPNVRGQSSTKHLALDPQQPAKYRVITTMVKLERGARDWFLVHAERDQARPKEKEWQNIFIFSSEAK